MYAVRWDGRDDEGGEVASGTYQYRLRPASRSRHSGRSCFGHGNRRALAGGSADLLQQDAQVAQQLSESVYLGQRLE